MLLKSITALATLAFAAHVAAEPMPYKPSLLKMSSRQLFGVGRRDENPGYQPTAAVCGVGSTCEEACGAGFTPCASKDSEVHCFNPAAGELCCPNQSGDSCDAGYYCTSDKKEETWCCPNEMDLVACAAAYKIDGGLVPQTAPAVSSSTSAPPSSTSAPATTSSWVKNSTISSGASSSASGVPSTTLSSANTTRITGTPTPTPSDVLKGAGNLVAPAGALALVVAGLAALL